MYKMCVWCVCGVVWCGVVCVLELLSTELNVDMAWQQYTSTHIAS